MKDTPEEFSADLSFRELFPPDEARLYARPEAFKLPAERVAYWSVAVSLLFAGVLVISWVYKTDRPTQRNASVPRINKQEQVRTKTVPVVIRKAAQSR